MKMKTLGINPECFLFGPTAQQLCLGVLVYVVKSVSKNDIHRDESYSVCIINPERAFVEAPSKIILLRISHYLYVLSITPILEYRIYSPHNKENNVQI